MDNQWTDLHNSIKFPSITTIGIMIIFPFIEIFLYAFIGNPLSFEVSMYTILITLIPFGLGYKVSNKIFENGEVILLLILYSFVIFSGITLKSNIFNFFFAYYWYILAILLCVVWVLIDFNEYTKLRTKRKEYNMKKNDLNTDNSKGEQVDGMEID